MSADGFCVCYGLRWEVDGANQDEVTLLERRQDPRQLAAKNYKLDSWWGLTTDQGTYFLVVGKLIGHFGWEGEHSARLGDAELTRVVEETRAQLQAAHLEGEPAWHCQFAPDY
jgi:hypothetical protein